MELAPHTRLLKAKMEGNPVSMVLPNRQDGNICKLHLMLVVRSSEDFTVQLFVMDRLPDSWENTPHTQRRVKPDQCYFTVQITVCNFECSL